MENEIDDRRVDNFANDNNNTKRMMASIVKKNITFFPIIKKKTIHHRSRPKRYLSV